MTFVGSTTEFWPGHTLTYPYNTLEYTTGQNRGKARHKNIYEKQKLTTAGRVGRVGRGYAHVPAVTRTVIREETEAKLNRDR
jgi:hypothetical protein